MSIFNRKTKKKHIEQFGLKIAELLESEMPQIKTAIGIQRAGALLTAQLRNRRNFIYGVKEERRNPEGQAKEYQYINRVAD